MIARLLFIVALGLPIGLGGAAAFNPDDGWLLRSDLLWTIFGMYAYVCLFTIAPLTLTAVYVGCRRRHA
jgi:hypothetical protein